MKNICSAHSSDTLAAAAAAAAAAAWSLQGPTCKDDDGPGTAGVTVSCANYGTPKTGFDNIPIPAAADTADKKKAVCCDLVS
jgi:hypothetical protein